MAFIQQTSEEAAEGIVAEVYAMARSRAGGIANIIRVMSNDGPSLKASMDFYVALMKLPGPLSSARREMLATVVSNVNDCYY